VQLDGQPLDFTVAQGLARQRRLDIGVPVSTSPSTVTIDYGFPERSTFDGWLPSLGVTFLWPYFCSNLFPCHSDPKEGATYSLRVTGAAPGLTVVAPTRIPNPAPSYMPAFAVGDYRYVRLGSTDAGTEVGYYVLPQEADGGVVTSGAAAPHIATAPALPGKLLWADWRFRTLAAVGNTTRWLGEALLFNTLIYFLLNNAFFRFPWPWQPWTTRTPNALVFAVFAGALVVWAFRQLRNPLTVAVDRSRVQP
jgi:hypothetical protein